MNPSTATHADRRHERSFVRDPLWLAAVLALVLIAGPALDALGVPNALPEARADNLLMSNDPAHIVWGENLGENADGIEFQAFGERQFIPKDRYEMNMIAIEPDVDGNIQRALTMGGNATDWCISAFTNMQVGNFDEARRRYKLAYDSSRRDAESCAGMLRFEFPALAAVAVRLLKDAEEDAIKGKGAVDWEDVLRPFRQYADYAGQNGTLVAQEYWLWTHLALQAQLRGRGAERVGDSLKRELDKMRTKLRRAIKKESDDIEELDAMADVCMAIYWHPATPEALSYARETGNIARRLRIIRKLIDLKLGTAALWEMVEPVYPPQLEELIDDTIVRDPDDEDLLVAANETVRAANRAMSRNVIADDARDCVVAINDYREALGLMRLRIHVSLCRAAVGHVAFLDQQDALTHDGEDGSTPLSRAAESGFPDNSEVEENLFEESSDVEEPALAAALAWRHDPEAHKKLCDDETTHVGIAQRGGIWVQVVGTPASFRQDDD